MAVIGKSLLLSIQTFKILTSITNSMHANQACVMCVRNSPLSCHSQESFYPLFLTDLV